MKNLKLILAVAVATTFGASAHDTPNALVDSQGKAVKGGFGQCIESVYNSVNSECGAVAHTPAPARPAPAPAPVVHEVGFSIGAKALFDTNKSVIRTAGRQQLNNMAAKIRQGKELGKIKRVTRILVTGHTDSRASTAYNQRLSERRASSVRSYLAGQGLNSAIIQARGAGELQPVATNKTAAGRQQNRRVEVNVQGTAIKN